MKHIKPDASKIPGFYEPKIHFDINRGCDVHTVDSSYTILKQFLSRGDIFELVDLFDRAPIKEAVSIQGLKDVHSEKGSERTTMWSEELADQLTTKLLNTHWFNKQEVTNEYSRTDSWQHVSNDKNHWDLVGFSPLLRFMEYKSGGQHYAHYDAGYIYPDTNYRTLKSVVIYLTTNSTGATRFIRDNQSYIRQQFRDNNDWDKEADPNLVIYEVLPVAGNVLIFNHRLCHDVDKFIPATSYERRIIIRADLIYKLK